MEGYNNRLYGIKEDMSVFYPDEAIKLAEEYMENTQEYTARDLYEKWEDPEHYRNIFFDDAKTRFDSQMIGRLLMRRRKRLSFPRKR